MYRTSLGAFEWLRIHVVHRGKRHEFGLRNVVRTGGEFLNRIASVFEPLKPRFLIPGRFLDGITRRSVNNVT